jgi:hypothetical protein
VLGRTTRAGTARPGYETLDPAVLVEAVSEAVVVPRSARDAGGGAAVVPASVGLRCDREAATGVAAGLRTM